MPTCRFSTSIEAQQAYDFWLNSVLHWGSSIHTRLLSTSGLHPRQLDDPNTVLTATQELCVVQNLLKETSSDVGLGLVAGLQYRFSVFGMWGYGLISSATVEDAIRLAMRYLSLTYSFTQISFHEDAQIAHFAFVEADLSDTVRGFLVERDVGATATLMHSLIGDDFRPSENLPSQHRPS